MGPEILNFYKKTPGELMEKYGESHDQLMEYVNRSKGVSSFVNDVKDFYQNKPEDQVTNESELVASDTSPEQPKKKSLPFDSILNYPEEEKRITDRVARQKAYEQKIAKTNALGEALKVLVEGAGAIGGATINRREPNNIGLKALENMRALDAEERDRLDRLRMLKLNNAVKNIEYEIQQDRITNENKRQDDIRKENNQFTINSREDEQTFRSEQAKTQHGYNMDEIKARGEQYRTQSQNRKPVKINGVDVTPDMITAMNVALIDKWSKKDENGRRIFDPATPRAIRDMASNETVREESIQAEYLHDWDYLQSVVPGLGDVNPTQPKTQTSESQRYSELAAEAKAPDTKRTWDYSLRERKAIKENKGLKDMDEDGYLREYFKTLADPNLNDKQRKNKVVAMIVARENIPWDEAEEIYNNNK